MSTSQIEIIIGLLKTSLPAVLLFIGGLASTTWVLGHQEIGLKKPLPILIGATLSLAYLGTRWLLNNWNTINGYWSETDLEDRVQKPTDEKEVVHGKFTWVLQLCYGEVSLVEARCNKCENQTIMERNSKKQKVRIYCSIRCFRQHMEFKGTNRTVLNSIKREVYNKGFKEIK